jgi:hypothetical protein
MTDMSPRTPRSNRSACAGVPLIGTRATAHLHRDAQPPRCNPDAADMAAAEIMPASTKTPSPRGSHPYTARGWPRTRLTMSGMRAREKTVPATGPGNRAMSRDRTWQGALAAKRAGGFDRRGGRARPRRWFRRRVCRRVWSRPRNTLSMTESWAMHLPRSAGRATIRLGGGRRALPVVGAREASRQTARCAGWMPRRRPYSPGAASFRDAVPITAAGLSGRSSPPVRLSHRAGTAPSPAPPPAIGQAGPC